MTTATLAAAISVGIVFVPVVIAMLAIAVAMERRFGQ